MGPHAKPVMAIPPRRANAAAREPSGVTSLMYALIVAEIVEKPPSRPSRAGPINRARYPPGARYGNEATKMKHTSLPGQHEARHGGRT